jgi:hypothetical protein
MVFGVNFGITSMFEIILYYENREYRQIRQLVSSKGCTHRQYFTFNSPIYKAIEDGIFEVDLGYGVHKFRIRDIKL